MATAPTPVDVSTDETVQVATPPAAGDEEKKGSFFTRDKYEGPQDKEGNAILIDFFPDDPVKCKEFGIPVWNKKDYRLPSKHIFTTEAILLEYQASVYQEKANALLEQAKDIRENPMKSTHIRKLKNHYDQFLALSATLREQGIDVDQLLKAGEQG